jgi:hypothetical protein
MQKPIEPDSKREAQAAFVERRSDPRYEFTATVEIVDPLSGSKVQARMSDLSRGGCYLDTMTPFPVGASVKALFVANGRSFEAQAKVVYCMPGLGMGMAFIAFASSEHLSMLDRWIGELSGELARQRRGLEGPTRLTMPAVQPGSLVRPQ